MGQTVPLHSLGIGSQLLFFKFVIIWNNLHNKTCRNKLFNYMYIHFNCHVGIACHIDSSFSHHIVTFFPCRLVTCSLTPSVLDPLDGPLPVSMGRLAYFGIVRKLLTSRCELLPAGGASKSHFPSSQT